MKWRAEGASLLSRGAALECSPGRKPGVNSNPGSQPQRGERFEWIRGILRPYGAGTSTLFQPRGLRPRLHSYAAPRLERANCNSFTPSGRRYSGGKMSTLPLSGVRVVDISSFLAGPMVSMFLGDYGADVIKVEHPGRGDEVRFWGENKDGVGLYYKVL